MYLQPAHGSTLQLLKVHVGDIILAIMEEFPQAQDSWEMIEEFAEMELDFRTAKEDQSVIILNISAVSANV